MFNCYLMYKQTRFMDSKEMARLIDGAIYVAKGLGIDTDTPEQIARRLKAAAVEMPQADFYDFIVINDQLQTAQEELISVATAACCCSKRRYPYLKF